MSRKNELKIDTGDRKILYQLDLNARQSISEIAKKVRLNKNTVKYRIERMEKEGLILNYYAIIDNSMLGYFSFRVYFKFFDTTPEKENEILKWLSGNGNISIVNRSEGNYDISFMVWVRDIHEFYSVWLEFRKRYKPHITNEKIAIFTQVSHYRRAYLLSKEFDDTKEDTIGHGGMVRYDELDIRILRMLARNARIRTTEMSSKLNVPPRTIAFRIKSLKKRGIIKGCRAHLNLELLGYEYYKINIVLNNMQNLEEMAGYAKRHPNIIYLDRTISNLDFEIDVEVKNKSHMFRIINDMKERFRNIREFEYFSVKEYVKLLYFPEK